MDIRGARLGDPTPLVPMNAHPDITKALSEAVTFSFTAAHMYHSMAWFFCQPGVGLDGIGAHFKLAATICSTDGCKSAWVRRGEERGQGETEEPSRLSLHSLRHAHALAQHALSLRFYSPIAADLIIKTGGMPRLGAIPAPPHDWHAEDQPDVLHCFELALALTKVEYGATHRLFGLAIKHGNPHLVDFAGNAARALGEKVRAAALYVSHLKAISPPPGKTGDDVDLAASIAKAAAMKAFDRILAVEDAPLVAAAAAEAALPLHLQGFAKERSMVAQAMDAYRGFGGDMAAQRALVLSKMNT